LRPTIASAFDLAVFCKREADGSRKVTEIIEVTSEVLD
jgi:pilus assembly protein CpaF